MLQHFITVILLLLVIGLLLLLLLTIMVIRLDLEAIFNICSNHFVVIYEHTMTSGFSGILRTRTRSGHWLLTADIPTQRQVFETLVLSLALSILAGAAFDVKVGAICRR